MLKGLGHHGENGTPEAQNKGRAESLGPSGAGQRGTGKKMELQRPKTKAELRAWGPLGQGRGGLEKWRGTDLTQSEMT